MIIGIGTDLIEIDRVLKACNKESFLKKYYTLKEIELIQTDKKKSADNFAVKEAVAKMFGTGFRGIIPIEIEVLRDELGRPYVNLYGKAKEKSLELDIDKIHVSISNTKLYSIAYVIGEGI
ncbi:holo-[acyl-carrier protein] synthase [Mobilisporobacter senegalensis]|uniref:Holo-[acyl-carrier-protein] synthase n=1 Tax=Mobilisporobacter senegalensis TaxID=1329262 RepID=A0A3N1XV99_9FIRM|nr:holo-ACP synthase [Mobilisporobacter senegalensis]ROR30544.1 holo-[acyl-carrier protein] synthase [Mobilisporobacter senegalensis]